MFKIGPKIRKKNLAKSPRNIKKMRKLGAGNLLCHTGWGQEGGKQKYDTL